MQSESLTKGRFEVTQYSSRYSHVFEKIRQHVDILDIDKLKQENNVKLNKNTRKSYFHHHHYSHNHYHHSVKAVGISLSGFLLLPIICMINLQSSDYLVTTELNQFGKVIKAVKCKSK